MLQQEQVVQLVDNLFYLFQALHRGMEADASKAGITVPQRIVMHQLFKLGPLSVKELSQKVGLTHSTISGIVDRLERKGMAARFQDPEDRRFTKVTVSENVKNYLQNQHPRHLFEFMMDVFKDASVEEQRIILDGVTTLRRLLDKEEQT